MEIVRAGNERVLSARLSDAAYFFDHDVKQPLGARVEGLKKVTYQEKLGTTYRQDHAREGRFQRTLRCFLKRISRWPSGPPSFARPIC